MADAATLGARDAAGAAEALNRDLLDRVPVDAAVVLHVGCGSGLLGAAFKRINPMARVLGIELDAAKARIAAGRLDEVAVAPLDAAPLPFALPGGVDCLIYEDLARLSEPRETLPRQLAELAPGGVVLAAAGNAEHWSTVARLLRGGADAEAADRLGARGLTRDAALRIAAEAGLATIDVFDRVADADMAAGFVGSLTPALVALGIEPADYLRRVTPLQCVLRGYREAPERLNVVSTMLAPVGGVTDVRVFDPMRCLATEPGITAVLSNGKEFPAFDGETPKIFILHRPALVGPAGYRVVQPLLAAGYVVVTEFDDHPDYIPILQTENMFNFLAVHAVQTTTEALAAVLRRDNDEVAVFPNGIRVLPDVANHAQRSHLTVFFGCLNRELDWPPYVAALNAVAAGAGERLRFAVVRDTGFFDALQTPYKAFYPTLEYTPYMNLLAQCELSFMPLVDNPFNRTKSDLKFIEAASCRVTALASRVVYADSIQDGVTGVLFRDPGELHSRLTQLVANMDAVRRIGDAARAWVAEHRMLAYQMRDRIAWYHALWARRAELTEALFQRVPQLAEAAAAAGAG
ncbi:MAG: glycosyltransferase [Alphaproteobacteria bacterium]|nr:glycosyltransferase [Alphaproteobacteria bacterium]